MQLLLDPPRLLLSAKVHLKLGLWRRSLTEELSEGGIASIMSNLKASTDSAPGWSKAWHHWAYFNCEAMVYYGKADATAAQRFVAPAVTGFFRSIELGQAAGTYLPLYLLPPTCCAAGQPARLPGCLLAARRRCHYCLFRNCGVQTSLLPPLIFHPHPPAPAACLLACLQWTPTTWARLAAATFRISCAC